MYAIYTNNKNNTQSVSKILSSDSDWVLSIEITKCYVQDTSKYTPVFSSFLGKSWNALKTGGGPLDTKHVKNK